MTRKDYEERRGEKSKKIGMRMEENAEPFYRTATGAVEIYEKGRDNKN